VEALVARAKRRHEAGDLEGVARAAAKLRRAVAQEDAALALAELVADGLLAKETGLDALTAVEETHRESAPVLIAAADALERVADIDDLNAASPDAPVFARVVRALERATKTRLEPDVLFEVWSALALVARLRRRQGDAKAERAARRTIELRPDEWQAHYSIGLLFKTRGRFREGLQANRRAAELGGAERDPVRWNLGICATGAGAGEEALAIWRGLGQKLELGRFGLPEGSYPAAKIRLAERPLAERTAEHDDPGLEENVWVERLSPCHGVIRCALYHDLGVDYGDAVLFDGAPVTWDTVRGERTPVFPHLATIARPGYSRFWFAGTQREAGELDSISPELPRDAVVYVHTEQLVLLCKQCASNPDRSHDHHDRRQHRIVRGKICGPPGLEPADLLHALDVAVAKRKGASILCPELARAAGDPARARVEERRVALLGDEAE